MLRGFAQVLSARGLRFTTGASWTTDTPYRELRAEVKTHQQAGVQTVEMEAAALFAGPSGTPYPIVASFSGTAEVSGRVLPFVAGVRSRGPVEETVGFYDPMGRAVLFLTNDGGRVTVQRGPAAGEFPPGNLRPVLAGPVSLGRILAGAPGYPVEGGEAGRTSEGGWAFRDGRQTLFSDAGRRHLARAEYGISGTRITVAYPGRDSSAPPGRVEVELPGVRILLRRDVE